MKIISWNVNWIRAAAKKWLKDFVESENPDILCLQETKAFEAQFLKEVWEIEWYKYVWHTWERAWYAGTVIFYKENIEVISTKNHFEWRDHLHTDGRVTEIEYIKDGKNVVLLNGYYPNGWTRADGTEMVTYKLDFYDHIIEYSNDLVYQGKNVILTWDLNIVHTEIDIARPKENQKTIWFLPIEREKVTELLDLVGLTDKHHTYPANLSGGQKQRVAIARALSTDPKVLLCDEATSALDPATTKSILELIKDLNRKLSITILIITHEMEVVKNICHQVAIIGDGELVEKGIVSDIFAHPKTKLAQEFIRATLDLSIPDDFKSRLQDTYVEGSYPLIRLEFTGASVDAPVISQISREFDIDISILNADIDYAGGVKFGLMLAEFFGNQESTAQAITFLRNHHVKVEVLGYVIWCDFCMAWFKQQAVIKRNRRNPLYGCGCWYCWFCYWYPSWCCFTHH